MAGKVSNSPDERRLGLASGVAEVQNQRKVAVVDSDTGDINDARDALLVDSQRLFAMPVSIGVDVL